MAIKKIGIYGGTFNPIHYGHLRTAEEVLELCSLDSMLFVPSGVTPFDKPDLEQAEFRYEMVKEAVKDNPHFDLSDIEVKSRDKSYTVDTVRKLKEKCPQSELYFILGTDAFIDLQKWKEPDQLVRLANLVVISRPGNKFADLTSSPYLKNVPEEILNELDNRSRIDYVFNISGSQKGHLCNVTRLDISASGIRSLIMSARNIKYLLPDSVKSYIISNKLYSRGNNT